MKKVLILALLLAVGVSFGAFAEVNDIKVSGSIETQMVNLDADLGSVGTGEKGGFVVGTTKLRFDADMTEDVSAVIELINERLWGQNQLSYSSTNDGKETDGVDIHLAYVKMKDFLGMPATITIGRQQMKIGSGLIMRGGSELSVLDTAGSVSSLAECFTRKNAVDGIRMQLDFDPVAVDLFYQKWAEGSESSRTDDTNYYGIDVQYNMSEGTNVGAYAIVKDFGGYDDFTAYSAYTYGARTAIAVNDNIDVKVEAAIQLGDDVTSTERLKANIVDVAFNYKMLDSANTKIGLAYQRASGDKVGSLDQEAWNKFRGGFDLGIATMFTNESSNVQVFKASMSRDIREDIMLSADYRYLMQARASNATSYTDGDTGASYTVVGKNRELGQSIDLKLAYDYTEDVEMGLAQGFFFPGQYFTSDNDQPAYATNAYVKVSF